MTKRKLIAIGLVVLILVGATVYKSIHHRKFFYVGTIESTRIDLPARLPTVISDYPFQEGDQIKKGDVLVKLDCSELDIAGQLIDDDFQRAGKLLKSGSIPREKYDAIQSKKKNSDLKRSWCQVSSPIDGVILTQYLDENEWAMPGSNLIGIANLHHVWAYIYVDQSVMAKLKLGMEVKGNIGGNHQNQVFKGKIIKINNEAEFTPKNVQTLEERSRLVFGIKIDFPNESEVLKPGMSIQVALPVDVED